MRGLLLRVRSWPSAAARVRLARGMAPNAGSTLTAARTLGFRSSPPRSHRGKTPSIAASALDTKQMYKNTKKSTHCHALLLLRILYVVNKRNSYLSTRTSRRTCPQSVPRPPPRNVPTVIVSTRATNTVARRATVFVAHTRSPRVRWIVTPPLSSPSRFSRRRHEV